MHLLPPAPPPPLHPVPMVLWYWELNPGPTHGRQVPYHQAVFLALFGFLFLTQDLNKFPQTIYHQAQVQHVFSKATHFLDIRELQS